MLVLSSRDWLSLPLVLGWWAGLGISIRTTFSSVVTQLYSEIIIIIVTNNYYYLPHFLKAEGSSTLKVSPSSFFLDGWTS